MLTAQPSTYDKFESCHMLMAEPSTYDNFLFLLLETNIKTCHMLTAQPSTYPKVKMWKSRQQNLQEKNTNQKFLFILMHLKDLKWEVFIQSCIRTASICAHMTKKIVQLQSAQYISKLMHLPRGQCFHIFPYLAWPVILLCPPDPPRQWAGVPSCVHQQVAPRQQLGVDTLGASK